MDRCSFARPKARIEDPDPLAFEEDVLMIGSCRPLRDRPCKLFPEAGEALQPEARVSRGKVNVARCGRCRHSR